MASLELKARLDILLSTVQAETANIDLFVPIAEREECPICLIPLPLNDEEISFMPCCGKLICNGCIYKSTINAIENGVQKHEAKCAFCRLPPVTNNIKALKTLMKKNEPEAFVQMSILYRSGDGVMQSDTRALEMYIRAAELGKPDAFGNIGIAYELGVAVEQDKARAMEFHKVAAKKGHLHAHKILAALNLRKGNSEESIDHCKVAACSGDKESMDLLMKVYKNKLLSKEDLAQTLRAFQASSNKMKSKDRDAAKTVFGNMSRSHHSSGV